MRLVVVGRAEEVAGFALAGVETAGCAAAGEVDTVVAELAARGAGLIFVSPWATRHAARSIAEARQRKGPPVIVTLPESGVEGG
jgi:vacuolar-type H+-ATPase subunit F/Vma7